MCGKCGFGIVKGGVRKLDPSSTTQLCFSTQHQQDDQLATKS
jgi:hypothetical protein